MKRGAKPNILILGASGGVASTFLHHLPTYRSLFGDVILVDPHVDRIRKNPYIQHRLLKERLVKGRVDAVGRRAGYLRLLKRHKADIVIDLTDGDTVPLLEATDEAGVSFITTGVNADGKSIPESIDEIDRLRPRLKNAPHVICAGMNPGCVNVWARYGIERHGKPSSITNFEYDTSQMRKDWRPMVTWSVKQFLEEAVRDDAGVVLGRHRVRNLKPNALVRRKGMRPVLAPVMRLASYPEGFQMFHEECSSVSNMYDVPSRFLYAIHPKTMQALIALYRKKKRIDDRDLRAVRNVDDVLEGSDTIGLRLDYPKKAVYYLNSWPNANVIGTNATYTQVVVGTFAAVFALIDGKVKRGVHFPEDIYRTSFTEFVFDNMRVQEFIFRKTKRGLKPAGYVPRVSARRTHVGHRYVI